MLFCRQRLSGRETGGFKSTFKGFPLLDPVVEALLDVTRSAFFPLDGVRTRPGDAILSIVLEDSSVRRAEDTQALGFEGELDIVVKVSLDVLIMDCT